MSLEKNLGLARRRGRENKAYWRNALPPTTHPNPFSCSNTLVTGLGRPSDWEVSYQKSKFDFSVLKWPPTSNAPSEPMGDPWFKQLFYFLFINTSVKDLLAWKLCFGFSSLLFISHLHICMWLFLTACGEDSTQGKEKCISPVHTNLALPHQLSWLRLTPLVTNIHLYSSPLLTFLLNTVSEFSEPGLSLPAPLYCSMDSICENPKARD